MLLMLVALLLPDAAPLLGMFAFGNLMKESGVVDRLSDTTNKLKPSAKKEKIIKVSK
jgi:Na+-transporting methylmalonyl-CoA/oxaloacetate decarboxylase beta subunit